MRASILACLDALHRHALQVGRHHRAWAREPRRCCGFCAAFPDPYMVTKVVWEEAGLDRNEIVCLTCLQRVLGRPLEIDDFNQSSINLPILFGYQMALNSRRES